LCGIALAAKNQCKAPQERFIPTFLIAFHYRLYPERLRGSFLNLGVSVLTKFPFAVYPAFLRKRISINFLVNYTHLMTWNITAGASWPSMIHLID